MQLSLLCHLLFVFFLGIHDIYGTYMVHPWRVTYFSLNQEKLLLLYTLGV